jgi:hypothetical protein
MNNGMNRLARSDALAGRHAQTRQHVHELAQLMTWLAWSNRTNLKPPMEASSTTISTCHEKSHSKEWLWCLHKKKEST